MMEARASEILFVTGTLDVGGAERHLLQIISRLIQRGWRISLYSLAGEGPLLRDFENAGAAVLLPPFSRRPGPMSWPVRIWRLLVVGTHFLALLVRRRPPIVHMFLPAAYVFAGPLTVVARVPIRIMSRRSLNLYRQERPVVWRIEQYLHRWMMAILGNSLSVVRELRDQEGVPAERLGLIYNGIDPRTPMMPRATLREKYGLPGESLGLVIVANLIAYKGHADLIEALVLAKPRLPLGWRLFVVGRDYGIGGGLKAQAERCGIASNVVFVGPLDDASEIVHACDIGLLVSHQEGFSNAVLEVMAAGRPIIVTDVGGNPEAVVDGESGIVVPPRDPVRLGEAILRLALDRPLRERIGQAALRRVSEHFSLEGSVESYHLLYRTLLTAGTLDPRLVSPPWAAANAGKNTDLSRS